MKIRTIAYCGGILDAEGCIMICKKPQAAGKSGYNYGPMVTIANKSRRLMHWLVDNFGGNYGKTEDRRFGPSGFGYRWWASNNGHISRFLDLVSPYLVLKRAQAEALRTFVGLNGEVNPPLREMLFQKLREYKSTPCVTTEVPDSLRREVVFQAYLAGFVDGDGFIQIVEHRHKGRPSGIQPVIGVGCTERFVPLQLQKLFGGSLYEKAPRSLGLRPVFDFRLFNRKSIEKCLLHFLPYLIVQRDRAKVVLDLCRLPGSQEPTIRDKRVELLSEYRRLKIQSRLTGDCERRPVKTQERQILS